jgi:hypothetical protein
MGASLLCVWLRDTRKLDEAPYHVGPTRQSLFSLSHPFLLCSTFQRTLTLQPPRPVHTGAHHHHGQCAPTISAPTPTPQLTHPCQSPSHPATDTPPPARLTWSGTRERKHPRNLHGFYLCAGQPGNACPGEL